MVSADSDLFAYSHARMHAGTRTLVAAAAADGAIRDDVESADLGLRRRREPWQPRPVEEIAIREDNPEKGSALATSNVPVSGSLRS